MQNVPRTMSPSASCPPPPRQSAVVLTVLISAECLPTYKVVLTVSLSYEVYCGDVSALMIKQLPVMQERSKVERNKILEAFLKALGHKFI